MKHMAAAGERVLEDSSASCFQRAAYTRNSEGLPCHQNQQQPNLKTCCDLPKNEDPTEKKWAHIADEVAPGDVHGG